MLKDFRFHMRIQFNLLQIRVWAQVYTIARSFTKIRVFSLYSKPSLYELAGCVKQTWYKKTQNKNTKKRLPVSSILEQL